MKHHQEIMESSEKRYRIKFAAIKPKAQASKRETAVEQLFVHRKTNKKIQGTVCNILFLKKSNYTYLHKQNIDCT